MRLFRSRKKRGQAAVETAFGIPAMLLMFLIGAYAFQVQWQAQYVHVKARYKLMKSAGHKPCYSNDDGTQALNKFQDQAQAQVPPPPFMGRLQSFQPGGKTIRAKAVIVCR